jgi:hypothetical protein
MKVEYQAILDEFHEELQAIAELADATRIGSSFSTRARTSLSNSLIMVLASTFEEYVRQLVKAAWNQRLDSVTNINELPTKLRAKIWKSALERAARHGFEHIETAGQTPRERIGNLLKFCIDGDLSVSVETEIAHNDNNMRPDQINDLFNRIGITNIVSAGCNEPTIIEFFNCQNPGQASEKLRVELNNFFVRRNNIVHAIVFGNSSGADTVDQDIEMLRFAALALANGADRFETQ